jgi:hypothetical protein
VRNRTCQLSSDGWRVEQRGAREPLATDKMANVLQFERPEQQAEPVLTPELKEFIDRVIVPILVKRFLAEQDAQDRLAGESPNVAESPGKHAA